jgi:hypothetical protein
MTEIFHKCSAKKPYWAKYTHEGIVKAINAYYLNQELSKNLSQNNVNEKKLKI